MRENQHDPLQQSSHKKKPPLLNKVNSKYVNNRLNPSGSSQMLPQISQGYNRPYHGNVHLSNNMAYVNVSSEGAKQAGPFLKKAEKDLIMRRGGYRNHYNDSINRVALIYGQNPQYNS